MISKQKTSLLESVIALTSDKYLIPFLKIMSTMKVVARKG
jgi:hypothetical protein